MRYAAPAANAEPTLEILSVPPQHPLLSSVQSWIATNFNAGIYIFLVRGNIVPTIKSLRIKILKLGITHYRSDFLRDKRRVHSDKKNSALFEVVIEDWSEHILARPEVLLPGCEYRAIDGLINHGRHQ